MWENRKADLEVQLPTFCSACLAHASCPWVYRPLPRAYASMDCIDRVMCSFAAVCDSVCKSAVAPSRDSRLHDSTNVSFAGFREDGKSIASRTTRHASRLCSFSSSCSSLRADMISTSFPDLAENLPLECGEKNVTPFFEESKTCAAYEANSPRLAPLLILLILLITAS